MPLTLGTAGHIDHGKTALVHALTGVDTDRLPEEKARGISIALGYAPLTLAARTLSVVDVPGHERFVRTMVAGATGIDLYLMVVAADDGVMPQTREHAAVLAALGVDDRRGRGHQGRPGATRSGRRPRRRSCCRAPRSSPVSARTGAGLDALRAALERAAARVASRDGGRPAAAARRPRVHASAAPARSSPGTLWSGVAARGDERDRAAGGPPRAGPRRSRSTTSRSSAPRRASGSR